ncbi:BglII/BstYI family type II restriction endonuclease [uncultured Oscillibacter sp.]|uniref:BglII/BstYI family type II restriction endonuclease n=1 Tax=uncultured Oscillibacter sp. TaxID=876091 RepID=UPI0026028F87|nr:BglII/BstYI family type II restriction endonuclease [uncultured Oscillibacter sp.]
MKIGQVYSHLNGVEFLLVHKRDLWEEIQNAVWNVDAGKAFDNTSRKKTMVGRRRYSPSRLNALFKQEFSYHGWHEMRIPYFVNEDLQTTKETVDIRDKELQRQAIISRGFQPYGTYNQVDFVKERVAVEVQFGKYFSVQYDLHVKHTFFYGRGDMDVGVEIIPMHSLMSQMSSGVAWYENELTNIVREGRSNPSVPLILIGVEPD